VANFWLSLAAAAARWIPARLRRALYRLGPLSAGLRSTLNRAAPTGLTEIEVAGGRLAGTRLWLDLQSEKDYWLGNYEIDLQDAIRDLVKPGMITFDLGANIGYISLLMAKSVGADGKVFAFEPLPENQERFRKNMSLNPSMQVELVPKAIAEKSSTQKFWVHNSGGMGKIAGATGRETQYQKTINVECTTLDDFVFEQGSPKPALIKIDIEGGEGLALRGMTQLIQEVKPLLIIELHGKQAAETCWEILVRSGYTIHKLTKGYQQIVAVSELDWKSYILARHNA
jgi:FkbM family methyltransferase